MTDKPDPYYYARDHERGPGAWCVMGPNGFKVVCDEKNCAYILGKMLSGKIEEATTMAATLRAVLTPRRATNKKKLSSACVRG